MARHVIKLGSGIVADSAGELRADVVAAICEEAARRTQAGDEIVIVSSGAIARGISLMGLDTRPTAIEDLQAASAVGQGRLYRAYDELLSGAGVRPAQVLLTFFDLSDRTNYLNARQTLRRLLDWKVVPVVNENDTTATDEITFGDNDFLAAQVAIMLEARLLVLLTNTDGVFTADPAHDPEARLIDELSSPADLEALEIGDRTSAFGTGGMRSKVAAAGMASGSGIEVRICNGTVDGTLARAAAGEAAGTTFRALKSDAPAFKQWLRYAKPVAGRIVVDEGAARVLRKSGSSLLPVGVTSIEGAFEAGDAVEVVASGTVIGKGIANYSAGEADRIKGMKSVEVLELMPHAAEELIHRDYFVLS